MYNIVNLIGKVISLKNNILVLKCNDNIFKINIKNIAQENIQPNKTIAISGYIKPLGDSTLTKIKITKILIIGE